MSLRSLDLFSGIGGITLALHGLAKPIAYCDWASESQSALATLMRRRLLPAAPVCPDVRDLNKQWFAEHGQKDVDLIVGGFPCVGFSPLGLRQAFENDESGLFREILRLVDVTRCPLVFLENVPNILALGMHDVARELGGVRGYELRWVVAPATFVGAPHKRARWYCLAVKPGFQHTFRPSTYTPYSWGAKHEPVRCVQRRSRHDNLRKGLLGNSVVPDVVRFAFLYLIDRCATSPKSLTLSRAIRLTPATVIAKTKRERGQGASEGGAAGEWRSIGILQADGKTFDEVPAQIEPLRDPPKMSLVFDPKLYRSTKAPSPLLSTGILSEPVSRRLWATPRHGMVSPVNFLTHRALRDLPSQVRFEKNTPDHMRGGTVSPRFVEYIMGYPLDWTKFDEDANV